MNGPASTWRDVVLMSDARVTAVPVVDAGHPLVDAAGALACTGGTPASRLLRGPVLERLVAADAALPSGLRIALNEGYRPPSLQQRYFDGYAARLLAADPGADPDDVHRRASRFVSPPAVAPHPAGAAVDVLLLDDAGSVLDVGCPIDTDPEASGGRCYTAHPEVTGEPRRLRDALATALRGAGFVNYPTEWWHWSYGDRYWAFVEQQPHARYGTAADPDPAAGPTMTPRTSPSPDPGSG